MGQSDRWGAHLRVVYALMLFGMLFAGMRKTVGAAELVQAERPLAADAGEAVEDMEMLETDAGVVVSEERLTYTDAQGNVFTYELDAAGNATIIGIHTAGTALVIPEQIDGAPVLAVGNENGCVVSNPETVVPELTINCPVIGARAFEWLCIGTLTLGECVRELQLSDAVTDNLQCVYGQFSYASIEQVVFASVELAVEAYEGALFTASSGPFAEASIGALEIGSQVTQIPEKMFAGCSMELDVLELQAARIGAYAFQSKRITIHHLILGEGVLLLQESPNSNEVFHQWQQFAETTIGTFTYLAKDMELGHAAEKSTYNEIYAPFRGSYIGTLELGAQIERIPECFLYQAIMQIEELRLTQPSIGAYAFAGVGVQIDTLILEPTIERFEESWFSTDAVRQWTQFFGSGIRCLKLEVPALQLAHTLDAEVQTDASVYAPFMTASVGSLEIGSAVQALPDYFLQGASMRLTELELHVPDVGAKAFSGSQISFGTLTIGAEVECFGGKAQKTAVHDGVFSECTIGRLLYYPTCAVTGTAGTQGMFENAVVARMEIADTVEYLDARLLVGCHISDCYVYSLQASETFLAQEVLSDALAGCENVHIHHNSDFLPYFSNDSCAQHWLCEEYYPEGASSKICSVCGYEEKEESDSDSTYDIYLSFPAALALTFNVEQQAYRGSEAVCVYGTVEDADAQVQLAVETENTTYGTAVKDGITYEIAPFLAAGFSDGKHAVFTGEQLAENSVLIGNGQTEGLHQETLRVTVDARAFLESGAGTYQIPIPLRISF